MTQTEQKGLSVIVTKPVMSTVSGDIRIDLTSRAQIGFQLGADGGHIQAGIQFACDQLEMDDWLEDGLGRDVTIFNTGGEVKFNGFVDTVQANYGNTNVTRGSMMDIINYLKVIYTYVPITLIAPPPVGTKASTAWIYNASSVARYGQLMKVINVGERSRLVAEQIGNMMLEEMREPRTQKSIHYGTSNPPSIQLNIIGYFFWLDSYIYNNAATGLTTPTLRFINALASCPGTLFSTDYGDIENNTFAINMTDNNDRTARAVVEGLIPIGDPTDYIRWVVGMKGRKAYYHKLPYNTIYANHYVQGFSSVFVHPTMSYEFDPWDVEPGKLIYSPDFMVGRVFPNADYKQDPRSEILETVTFQSPRALQVQTSKISTLSQKLAQWGLAGIAVPDPGGFQKGKRPKGNWNWKLGGP